MTSDATSSEIDQTASRWVVREDAGPLSATEQAELDAWLAEDARHLGAYARAQAVWFDADRVAALAQDAASAHTSARPSGLPWRAVAAAALAASLLVAAGALVLFRPAAGSGVVEMAEIGEIRRIVLEDGSMLVLNTGSAVSVDFTADRRSIALGHGEAAFQVRPDAERPFVVTADGISVQAIGTHFSVRRREDGLSVTVAEGVVEVDSGNTGAGPRRAEAGTYIRIAEAGAIDARTLDATEIARRLSWQEGQLIFNGQTLAEAVEEMNRYSTIQIDLSGSGLSDEHFVGAFRAGDTRTFAETVATAFDARVIEENGVLRISTT